MFLCSHWRIYIQNFPAHAPHPYRTQFFHFHIHFHRKAPASEVHTPSKRVHAPPLREILAPIYLFTVSLVRLSADKPTSVSSRDTADDVMITLRRKAMTSPPPSVTSPLHCKPGSRASRHSYLLRTAGFYFLCSVVKLLFLIKLPD